MLLLNPKRRQNRLRPPWSAYPRATLILPVVIKTRYLFIFTFASRIWLLCSMIALEIFMMVHGHAVYWCVNSMYLCWRIGVEIRWHHHLSTVFTMVLIGRSKSTFVVGLIHHEVVSVLGLLNWKFNLLLKSTYIPRNSHSGWLIDCVLL